MRPLRPRRSFVFSSVVRANNRDWNHNLAGSAIWKDRLAESTVVTQQAALAGSASESPAKGRTFAAPQAPDTLLSSRSQAGGQNKRGPMTNCKLVCAGCPYCDGENVIARVKSDHRELDLTDRVIACKHCQKVFSPCPRARRRFAAYPNGHLKLREVVCVELRSRTKSNLFSCPKNGTKLTDLLAISGDQRGTFTRLRSSSQTCRSAETE